MSTYSHSRLECFRQCPRRYRFRYGERIPPRVRTIEAFMGSQVHTTLECLYREAAAGKVPSWEAVAARYEVAWEAAARRLTVPLRVLPDRGSEARWRALGASCLRRYFEAHWPFPEAERTLGLEAEVHFPLDRQRQVWLRGYVDRLTRGADDVLEIHDYKTAREVPRPEFFDDAQLCLYQLGLGRVFPAQRGVRLVWHYLATGEEVVRTKEPAALEVVRAQALATVAAVEAEQTFPPRPGTLCRWCEYRDLCPAGRRWTDETFRDDPEGLEFVWRYAALKAEARTGTRPRAVLRREADHLKSTLLDFVRRTGREVLQGEPGRLVVEADASAPAVRLEGP